MKELACKACGHVGAPQGMGAGRALFGGALCAFGLLPGLLYFAVLSLEYPQCAECCQKNGLVPLNSLAGRSLLRQLEEGEDEDEVDGFVR